VHVYYASSEGIAVTVINDTTIITSPHLVSGLFTSQLYSWRVRAKNQYGWGSWSASNAFTTIDSADLVENPSIQGFYWDASIGFYVRGALPYLVIQNNGDNVYQPKTPAVVTYGSNGIYTNNGKAYSPIYLSANWRLRLDPTANSVRMEFSSTPTVISSWITVPIASDGIWNKP
jgi:hypothetical protein